MPKLTISTAVTAPTGIRILMAARTTSFGVIIVLAFVLLNTSGFLAVLIKGLVVAEAVLCVLSQLTLVAIGASSTIGEETVFFVDKQESAVVSGSRGLRPFGSAPPVRHEQQILEVAPRIRSYVPKVGISNNGNE